MDLANRFFVIIDSDILLAVYLATAIEAEGGKVAAIAPTAARAVDAAQCGDADCAILDPYLAGESALAAALRFMERGIPVVVSTDRDHEVLPPELLACSYVRKPWTAEGILKTCGSALARREEVRTASRRSVPQCRVSRPTRVERGSGLERDGRARVAISL